MFWDRLWAWHARLHFAGALCGICCVVGGSGELWVDRQERKEAFWQWQAWAYPTTNFPPATFTHGCLLAFLTPSCPQPPPPFSSPIYLSYPPLSAITSSLLLSHYSALLLLLPFTTFILDICVYRELTEKDMGSRLETGGNRHEPPYSPGLYEINWRRGHLYLALPPACGRLIPS